MARGRVFVRYSDACASVIYGADFGRGLGGDRFDQFPLDLGAKQRIDVDIATLARRVAQIEHIGRRGRELF